MTDEQLEQMLLEAMMFERWLRFQFLEEAGESVIIFIPEEWLAHIAAMEPHFEAMARTLNKQPVSLENSRNALYACFSQILARAGRDASCLASILESPRLWQLNEQASAWLAGHEQTLPRLEFAGWLALFQKWQEACPTPDTAE